MRAFFAGIVLLLGLTLAMPAPAAVVANATPPPGTLTELTQIHGPIQPAGHRSQRDGPAVNGQFASSVFGSGTTYIFNFLQPAYGLVQISWDVGHGIQDLAPPGNPSNATGPGATWQYTLVDLTPPTVASVIPAPGRTVASLTNIEVLFSEPVSGVNAGDLLINSSPASSVTVVTPSQYLFQFPQPASGTIQITWANNHSIQDLATTPNPFPAGVGVMCWTPNAASTRLVISEFVAQNDNGILDEDLETSDWNRSLQRRLRHGEPGQLVFDRRCGEPRQMAVPLHQPGAQCLSARLGIGEGQARGRRALHTNFKLDGSGEYLALVRSNVVGGLEVIWEYAPKYPNQEPDISYGLAMNVGAYGTLIPIGATAKVLIPTGDLGVNWTAPGFNDGSWSTVVTGIGFDTGTNYDPASPATSRRRCSMSTFGLIRIPFNVSDPSVIQDLRLRLRYDDGLVAYLNGVEALRVNAPANPQWNSTATALHGSGSGASGILQADFDTVTNTYTASQQGVAPALPFRRPTLDPRGVSCG